MQSKKKEKRIIPEISEPVQKESETEEIAEGYLETEETP